MLFIYSANRGHSCNGKHRHPDFIIDQAMEDVLWGGAGRTASTIVPTYHHTSAAHDVDTSTPSCEGASGDFWLQRPVNGKWLWRRSHVSYILLLRSCNNSADGEEGAHVRQKLVILEKVHP